MAYVAISHNLIQETKNRIETAKRNELVNELGGYAPHELQVSSPALAEALMWYGHEDLMKVIPSEWLKTSEDVRFNIKLEEPIGRRGDISIELKSAARAVIRPNASASMYGNTIHVDENTINLLPETTPDIAKLRKLMQDHRTENQITEKWQKIEAAVIEFLKSCKSLNEAVKLMPNIRLYVPDDYAQRLDRKASRSEPSEAAAKIPSEEISAAAVAARLMGAF